jgi:hypothetical protein
MIEREHRFARVHGGKTYFAQVAVAVEDGSGEVAVMCSGHGFRSQGQMEEVPAVGYDDWKAGAIAGVRHALAQAGRLDVNVTISRIVGISTDTNPTIVGAAAARAVWGALGFEAGPVETARVDAIVFSSWQRAQEEPPSF